MPPTKTKSASGGAASRAEFARLEPNSEQPRIAATLLQICDAAIVALLFVAPLFMGGRHPLGELVVAVCSCTTALAWLARQYFLTKAVWNRTGVELFLLAVFVIVLLQLMPLPRDLLLRLSPSLAEYLPLWFSGDAARLQLGEWKLLSLTPEATRGGLALFIAYALFFWTLTQRIQSVSDAERLLKWLACSAVFFAIIGLAQFGFGNGKFLWIYEHPERTAATPVRGPFINENHFAQLLALGIGPLLVWFVQLGEQSKSKPTKSSGFKGSSQSNKKIWPRFLVALAIGIVCNTALLTYSRGGVIVVLLAGLSCVFWLMRASLLSKKISLGLLGTGAVVFASLLIFGYEQLRTELESLSSASFEKIESASVRRSLWEADLKAFRDFSILGTGVGSHREVYPIFFSKYPDVEFTHAESGYVQIMLETGGCGLVLLATALGVVGFWSWRLTRAARQPNFGFCRAAILSGLLASLVHSVWDFVWYIPACMSFLLVLLACACRLSQLSLAAEPANFSKSISLTFSRTTWGLTGFAVACVAWIVVCDRLPAARAAESWDRYRRLAATPEKQTNPKDQDVAAFIRELEQVLRRDGHNGRAHLRAAKYCLARFNQIQTKAENPLELVFIRDAALSSQFANRAAQDEWLDRVIGQNRRWLDLAWYHSQQAARLCPLQGEAYLYLAQLSFLQGVRDDIKPPLIRQALRVRPHNGEVLITAGAEAGLAGDPEKQLEHWRQAFQQSPEVQQQLIQLLAPSQPVEFFMSALRAPPAALVPLFQYYVQAGRQADAKTVGEARLAHHYSSAQAATGQVAANHWADAYQIHQLLQQPEEALECIQKSVALSPDVWSWHWLLAHSLQANERWDEAVEEFKWCQRRRSADVTVRDQLAATIRRQVQAKRPTEKF